MDLTNYMNISIIGFGEAGPVVARTLLAAGFRVSAYDRLQLSATHAQAQIKKMEQVGVTVAANPAALVTDADLIISTVTASEALVAASSTLDGLTSQSHWLDLNSISPASKMAVASCVKAKGCGFTEAVAMDTVPAKGAKVPILMCGADAQRWSSLLNQAGMNTSVIGERYGLAASTKLLRSIIIKGMESLFAESIEAAGRLGVQERVLDSMQATYPGLNWEEVAAYQLSRSVQHAARRAAEMKEAASLVKSLDIEPLMSNAIASKQQSLADRQLKPLRVDSAVRDFVQATQPLC